MGEGRFCGKCGQMAGNSQASQAFPPTQPTVVPPQPSNQGQWQAPPPPGQQSWQPQPPPGQYSPQGQWQQPPSKDKMTAGLLAIFIGGLGIHKFYLGGSKQRTAGVIQLVLSLVSCGVLTIIPLIEGILYLTKDDQQFQMEYVYGDKDWF